ncbi:MAG: hypothetical protein WCV90_06550 [Candidatus Woesearchaeota archaeon]
MSYSWGSDTSASWSGSNGGFDYGSAKNGYTNYDADKAYVSKSGGSKKSETPKKSVDMKSAYMMSARVVDAAMPGDEKSLLKELDNDRIVVIPGQYDSVEKVLSPAGIPYKIANGYTNLDPKQILLVNCPGRTLDYRYRGKSGTEALQAFVNAGGYLVTTDWALESVIMNAFPGHVERGKHNTSDDLVEVDLIASGSPYTKGLGNGALKPIWWLESSSYPIRPLRKEGLEILLGSAEMGNKYGESPIAVKFPVGEGRVIHVTSHFYLQTVKSKYDAQANKSGLDFATKFLGIAADDAKSITGIGDMSFGAIESAYTSLRFLSNIFLQKVKQDKGLIELPSPEVMQQLGGQNAVSLRKLPPGTASKRLI